MAENKVNESPTTPVPASQPEAVSNPGSVNPNPKKWNQKQMAAGLLILAVLVIGLSAYLYNRSQNVATTKPLPATSAYSQTYSSSSLANNSLAGSGAGHGLSFKKPYLLSTQETTSSNQAFVQLAKSTKNDGSYIDIARLIDNAKDFSSPSEPSAGTLKAVKYSFIQDPSTLNYKTSIQPLQDFANSGFPEGTIAVKLGKATTFTNSYIKDNAWQFDVTTNDSTGKTPAHSGKLVFLLGKNTKYKFMITAVSNNWQSNSGIFQQILDSLQIDQ